jgi:hypothetical protein
MEIFNVEIKEDRNRDNHYSEGPEITAYNYYFFSNEKAQEFIRNYIYEHINKIVSYMNVEHVYKIDEYVDIYNSLEQDNYIQAIDIIYDVVGIEISVSKSEEDKNDKVILNEKFIEYAHKCNKIKVFK